MTPRAVPGSGDGAGHAAPALSAPPLSLYPGLSAPPV